jgi:Flp pilus assembly protein TadB
MSALAIVLICVAVVLVIALLAVLLSPKRRAERRLRSERNAAAEHHRAEARARAERAEVADHRAEEARLQAERAQQEARLEREHANLHEGRADLHDRGLADDELGLNRDAADRDMADRGMTDGDMTDRDFADRDTGRTGRFVRDDEREPVADRAADEDVAATRREPRT